jgi:hypothetical protein
VAVVFCTRCGCENAPTRGACLRCYNPLEMTGGSVTCAECGEQTLAGAQYCRACGAALDGAPPRVPCSLQVAIDLVLGGEEGIGPEEEFEETIGPVGVPELDFGLEEEEEEESAIDVAVPPPPPATPAPPPPPPPPEEVPVAEPELTEEALFEPAEPAEAEEESTFAPPPPPPAPDEIPLDDEESRPTEEALFEPAEPAEAEDEITFAPPPPPPAPDEIPLDDEESRPAEEAPSFAPPEPAQEAPTDEEKEEEDESKGENLGGWVIDFDKE